MIYEAKVMMNTPPDRSWWQTPIDAFSHAFREMHPWMRNLFVFAALIFVATYFLMDKISPALAEITKTPKERAYDENLQTKYMDSLTELRKEQFTRESLIAQKEINNIIERLKNNVSGENHVTIWKMHDHGGPLNNGQPKYISVLYTTEDLPNIDLQESWTERLAPRGYANLAQKTLENGRLYVPSVSRDSSAYFGQTKESMDLLGTKSIMLSYIKTLGSGVVFISISFGKENPTEENPYALARLENEKERLKNYIKDVPQSLK